MSDIEKLYLSNSIPNGAARSGSDFDDNATNAIPPDQNIDDFVNSATRPIRARHSRSRPGTICLYQIGHFEHFLEKLGFVLYDNQQRRRDAHFAIETCIRPRLDPKNPTNKAVRLEKLHALVEQRAFNCSAVPAASHMKNQAPTTHKTGSLALTTSRKVGNAILIPDGISIAGEKASDVIAEKYVKAADFTPGLKAHIYFPANIENYDDLSTDVDAHYINTLSEHIQNQLHEADDATLIVFEMKNENDEENALNNWKAAYDAAKKVRQASDGKKSIMLVPSAEAFELKSRDGSTEKIDKETVLQDIQNFLSQPNQKRARTLAARNPYAYLDDQ